VTSFVPALTGHVELQREGGLFGAVAGLEVPAGAARPFEGLHLADEDAMHQLTSGVGSVWTRRRQLQRPAVLGVTRRARIHEPLLGRDADEAVVSGQQICREDLPHE